MGSCNQSFKIYECFTFARETLRIEIVVLRTTSFYIAKDADDIVSFSYLPISVPTEPCENPRDLSPLDVSSIRKKILMDGAQAAHEVHGVSPVLDGGEDDCMGLSRHQHTRHMVVRSLFLTNVRCVAGMRCLISLDDRSACGRLLSRIQAAESSDSIM